MLREPVEVKTKGLATTPRAIAEPPKVINLMEALRRSLAQDGKLATIGLVSKAQRGGSGPAVSIEPAPSPRPAAFGLQRISSCREADWCSLQTLRPRRVYVPNSLLRSPETVLDLSAHVAALVK